MEDPDGGPAAMMAFLQQQQLLSARDKRQVLSLINKTLDVGSTFVHAASMAGISIFRADKQHAQHPSGTNKSIYRVSGLGDISAPSDMVFELLCNLDLMPEWDMLYKGARYLSFARDPHGTSEVGHIHLVYGLPGMSRLVSDRDFVLRTVRVFFPNGMRVLACSSVAAGEPVEGDPGPRAAMIRGHMSPSGYVVVPTPNGGSCLHVSLQVDPKGWIPSSVVNLSLEAIPLNIQRIRNTLQQLPPPLLDRLPALNQAQALGALPLPLQRSGLEEGGAAAAAAAAAAGLKKAGARGAAAAGSGVEEGAAASGSGRKSVARAGGAGGSSGAAPGMTRVEEWLLSSGRQEGGAAARAAGGAAARVVLREQEGEEADAAAVIHCAADGSILDRGSSKARQQQAPAGLRRRVRGTR